MNKFNMFTAIILLITVAAACKQDNYSKGNKKPEFYFTGEIAGREINFEVDDNGATYSCSPFEQQNSTERDHDYYLGTVVGEAQDMSKSNIFVTVLKYFNHDPARPELASMIEAKNFGYGAGDQSKSTIGGAVIMYLDENGGQWSSELGPQTTSSFSVSEVSDCPGSSIKKVIKASFSCKLYDPSGKNSIQLSNGRIRGLVF